MTVAARTSFSQDTHGVAILEFALIFPILLLLSFGGYATTEYILASRKAALACRTVADLASKYATISGSDMADILNASVLVIAPLPSAPLTVRLSEVSADSTGTLFTVVWSKGLKTGPYAVGSTYAVPADLHSPNAVFIVSEITYAFTPKINYGIAGPFTATARSLVPPRGVDTVRYTGS